MKSVDEVKPFIEKIYHRIPGKNANDIAQIKTEDLNYVVYKTDGTYVTILRRPIDLYIDTNDKNAEAEIISILGDL